LISGAPSSIAGWARASAAQRYRLTAMHADASPQAVALRYADGDAAPVVVAKGRGLLAEEIIRRAREAGVFVHASRDLVALLMQVDLDARIPPAVYVAVAELLAWLHDVDVQAGAHAAPPARRG
jgi:flagellar biosynthesis protein